MRQIATLILRSQRLKFLKLVSLSSFLQTVIRVKIVLQMSFTEYLHSRLFTLNNTKLFRVKSIIGSFCNKSVCENVELNSPENSERTSVNSLPIRRRTTRPLISIMKTSTEGTSTRREVGRMYVATCGVKGPVVSIIWTSFTRYVCFWFLLMKLLAQKALLSSKVVKCDPSCCFYKN